MSNHIVRDADNNPAWVAVSHGTKAIALTTTDPITGKSLAVTLTPKQAIEVANDLLQNAIDHVAEKLGD